MVYSILRGEEIVRVSAHKPQAATRLGVTIKDLTDEQQAQARAAVQRAAARTAAAAEAAEAEEAPSRLAAPPTARYGLTFDPAACDPAHAVEITSGDNFCPSHGGAGWP